MLNIFQRFLNFLNKPTREEVIMQRVLDHQLSLIGKYDIPEFKALPHIDQFSTIIFDSIIPDLYKK